MSIRFGFWFLAAWLAAVSPAQAGLFGSSETENHRIDAFTKWLNVLVRHAAETRDIDAPCSPGGIMPCVWQDWKRLVDDQRGKPLDQQLDAVNRYMNRWAYVTDLVNWGMPDYWETPGEFMRRNGDCEDYAIAKYFTLKELGVDPDQMRIVIVQDLNLKVPHAVLAVFVNGDAQILDNQIAYVRPNESIYHYRPIYSINETAWWLHRPVN